MPQRSALPDPANRLSILLGTETLRSIGRQGKVIIASVSTFWPQRPTHSR